MDQPSKAVPIHKRWFVQIGVATLLAALSWILLSTSRLKDPKVAVETYFDCIEGRDSGCLMALTGEYEGPDAPTEVQMREFVNRILEPRLSGFLPVGPIQFESGLDNASESFGTKLYRHADGREIYVSASGRITEGRAVCWPNFPYVVMAVCQTYARKGEVPGGREVQQRALANLKPQMEAIGIKGAFLNTNEGERFYTWEEWIGRLTAR